MLAKPLKDCAMYNREKADSLATFLNGKPSRFELIGQLIEINAEITRLAMAPGPQQESFEDHEKIFTAVYRVGVEWAQHEPDGTPFRLPALLVDLQDHAPDSIGGELFDWFYNGYQDSLHRRCVFPQPRPRDKRPSAVCGENRHFWLSREKGGFLLGSNNVSGGFGSAWLPPAALVPTLQTLTQGNIQSAKAWYLDDPYGMATPQHVLLRDDRKAGWDHEHNNDPWSQDSITLGELSLLVEHPGQGEIYLGAPAQEAEQLRSLASLIELALGLKEKERTPEYRMEAEKRAQAIGALVAVSFLPLGGLCYRCETDVTLLLSGLEATSHLTGCPACGQTWCD